MYRRNLLKNVGAALSVAALSRPLFALEATDPYLPTIGLQLWTVRNQMEADRTGTLKAIKKAGYHQVELMEVLNSKELVKTARDEGLEVTSGFFDWRVIPMQGENGVPPFEKVLDAAKEVGLKHLVFGYVGKGYRETESHYKTMAERSNVAGELALQAGIQLCYHNHSFEFAPLQDAKEKTGFDVFMQEFDPSKTKFELDVFWVKIGGWDPLATMEKLKGRISQVHLKDLKADTVTTYDEGTVPNDAFQELGDGIIPMKQVTALAKQIGVDQCHVEQDQSEDPLASIVQSAKYLHQA